jgi:hypothetical protein
MKDKLSINFLKQNGVRFGTSPGSKTVHFINKDKLKSGYFTKGNIIEGYTEVVIYEMVPIENFKYGFSQINPKTTSILIKTKQDLKDFLNNL